MLPGDEIWKELGPRLGATRPAPLVIFQAELGPDEGGPPLSRILAWAEEAPKPHWLLVTCGLSASRFVKGYPELGGIELVLRLARGKESSPPGWLTGLLQRLGRDAFREERPLKRDLAVDQAPLVEPLNTGVTAGLYAADPVFDDDALVELVALTPVERMRVTGSSSPGERRKLLLELAPGGITDFGRVARPQPQAAQAASPRPAPPVITPPALQTLSVQKGARMRLSVAAQEAAALGDALLAAVRAGRLSYQCNGWTIHLNVEDISRSATWATTLAIYFTVDLAKEAAAALRDPARHGRPLHFGGLPDFELVVVGGPGAASERPSVLSRIKGFFGGS